ncbi:DNA-binding protein [Planococcus sp. YIM B11945]|uniref:DNA-binding protein n=1 Tax=Planococcus sp. YIM B11945 TaxID=3435410 RepID=UPI003D7E3C59
MTEQDASLNSDFPAGIGKPARQALFAVGIYRLEQLTEMSEKEVLKMHGVGPKAFGILREALLAKDMKFKGNS